MAGLLDQPFFGGIAGGDLPAGCDISDIFAYILWDLKLSEMWDINMNHNGMAIFCILYDYKNRKTKLNTE